MNNNPFQSILVTGGSGFIGSNFLHLALGEKSLFPKLSKIINLDKLTYAGNPANLASLEKDERYLFVQADISDEAKVSELLKAHNVDAIVHFAAESHVDRSIDSPEAFFQTNVLGTVRLLNSARHYWKTLPADKAEKFRFLHVSTDEVFGSLGPQDPAFCEETPYHPNSPYSASKAASDHAARAYFHTYGLPVIITNCSNNYGPYQFPEKWQPSAGLEEGLKKTIQWYLEHRDWCAEITSGRYNRARLGNVK